MATKKVAIVTGAASGIGLALATSLVQKNWLVALLDINTTGGTVLATKLGPSALFIETDVASYASQQSAFTQAFAHFGRIDAVCANAGIVDRWSLYDLRDTKARTVQDVPPAPDLTATNVDLKGVIYGIRLAVHFMRFNPPLADGSTPGKKIVVTSSIAGAVPHPALPEYSAAKSGVIGLVRAIAPVLKAREGIAVNALCPGLAATAVLPEFVVDAVGGELLTPVAEVVKAY
ncbi:hypothetical protein B0T14DRAFT_497626 [Immersiella caudata]|uniref:Uncharacterized protein n=1 Tax=Immersiella caudata TaxID=314043 RepID=A0AA39WJ44_9PEZI|nr:hypothetical protein B0T14DRAFT_497626 [Immersiella caudata]